MSEQRLTEPLLCRLFGHRWKPSHVLSTLESPRLKAWVYLYDVCQRCHLSKYRLGEYAAARDEYARLRYRP